MKILSKRSAGIVAILEHTWTKPNVVRVHTRGMIHLENLSAGANWKERFIPIGVSCDFCKTNEPTKTRYGTPKWARNPDRHGGYLCWPCYITKNNTGRIFSQERKQNISIRIRRALDAGTTMGPKVHTIDETVFDTITALAVRT